MSCPAEFFLQCGLVRNDVYVGKTVFNKRAPVGSGKKYNDESEWIIVEDTYKPIISKEDFNKVQELMSKRKKQNGKNNVDRKLVSLAPLAGLFSCHYSFKIKWLCS